MSLKSYLLLSLGACTLCANAYVVARFDLGAAGSPVATGWQSVFVGVNSDNLTSISGTQAGTTVEVFANTVLDARDRGLTTLYDNETVNPVGSLTPVLRDFLFDNGNTEGVSMTVEFTGLLPNNSTTLTRDLVYSGGSAISMAFGVAGDLPAGVWEVSMWSWDQDVPLNIAPATVGYRVNGGSDVVVDTGLSIDSAYPLATFQFTSDGVSGYEVFIRSDTLSGNARLNAVSLSLLPAPSARLIDFTYDPSDGSAEVRIKGAANINYKLVEADDLDFANPDQDPIPLAGATVGTLAGNEVTTDGSGNATVQFNLGTAKDATFLRAETAP